MCYFGSYLEKNHKSRLPSPRFGTKESAQEVRSTLGALIPRGAPAHVQGPRCGSALLENTPGSSKGKRVS